MKKIIWGYITSEVTRRCQLACPHCCHGNSQNVDMTKDTVNAFLDQTAAIRILGFSGGEPTLNVEIMEYWISEMKRREIPLGGIFVFTNAVELTERLKQFYKDAYTYIDFCRNNKDIFTKTETLAKVNPILVQISKDSYHDYDIEDHYMEYNELFRYFNNCYVFYRATIPFAIGKAKNIAALNYDVSENHSISIVDNSNPHICCTEMETTNLIRYADAYVPCGIYIDANGKILSGECELLEYEYLDNRITGITNLIAGKYPPILDEIRKFNNGKMPCYKQIRTHKLSLTDIIAISQYRKESKYDNVPRVEMNLELQRKGTILKDNYKQARIEFLEQKVLSYKEGNEDPKIDFPNLNSRFFDHLEQMLNSTNNNSTIACWLDEAIRRHEYMVESDEILDLIELIDVSDLFSNYDNTDK